MFGLAFQLCYSLSSYSTLNAAKHMLYHIPNENIFSFICKIKGGDGNVTITNDGATILKKMQVLHPVAKMVNWQF